MLSSYIFLFPFDIQAYTKTVLKNFNHFKTFFEKNLNLALKGAEV